jgi:hypothetical protein
VSTNVQPSIVAGLWHLSKRPGERKALNKSDPLDQLTDKFGKTKTEKHVAVARIFCHDQFMDVAEKVAACPGMSTP